MRGKIIIAAGILAFATVQAEAASLTLFGTVVDEDTSSEVIGGDSIIAMLNANVGAPDINGASFSGSYVPAWNSVDLFLNGQSTPFWTADALDAVNGAHFFTSSTDSASFVGSEGPDADDNAFSITFRTFGSSDVFEATNINDGMTVALTAFADALNDGAFPTETSSFERIGLGQRFFAEWSSATFDVASASPIPVPAALPLLLTALGALGWVARRRRSA